MGHFSYKGGCGVCERTLIKPFKRRAGLGIEASGFSNINVIKNSCITKNLKNKLI